MGREIAILFRMINHPEVRDAEEIYGIYESKELAEIDKTLLEKKDNRRSTKGYRIELHHIQRGNREVLKSA